MTNINGIGWILKNECGCIKKNRNLIFDNIAEVHGILSDNSIITAKFQGYKRFDDESKKTFCATALAIYDSGISDFSGYGIIGTNPNGSLDSNLLYFRDYFKASKTIGRGNLFIYTLPSSPLAESSIAFGLKGPLYYLWSPGNIYEAVLEDAIALIESEETEGLILSLSSNHCVLSLSIIRGETEKSGHVLEKIRNFIKNSDNLEEILSNIRGLV